MNIQFKHIAIALILIFGGSFLASIIQTNFGQVSVSDVRFESEAGQTMSGLLYVPSIASKDQPQPGILAVHGYINSRETQSGFAIELSRRGFVVLALDQTGHGYSDPPAFSEGFGGPAGLSYLRALPFVDKSRIGLEGHSMGGWAVLAAAGSDPDGYSTMVLEGSSTGTFGSPEGTDNFPRDLLLVFSLFDEFSDFMWGAQVPADIVNGEKLQKLFGTDKKVEPNRLYGDAAGGYVRQLMMPAVTHPGDHHSTEAIGMAVDWLQQKLKPEQTLDIESQHWYWKELGTTLALLGMFLLIFPLIDLLLSRGKFSKLKLALPQTGVVLNRGWVIAAVFTALIPVLTFFPLQTWGGNLVIFDNRVWSQSITSGIVIWMLGTGLISLALFIGWFKFQQSTVMTAKQCGLVKPEHGVQALLCAVLVLIALYVLAYLVDLLFTTDFRIWVVALKLMSAIQLQQFLVYLPFFAAYFVLLGCILHTQMRIEAHSKAQAMIVNSLLLSAGFVLLLAFQYLPLLMGGTLSIASQPLLTIVALQFVPLMVLIACVSTWCFYRTGSVYLGAFVNAFVICWYVTAGQATQTVPFLF